MIESTTIGRSQQQQQHELDGAVVAHVDQHEPALAAVPRVRLRAALACTIVGVSVYTPPALKRHLTFPAISYLVTVIIVTDATVGTALCAAASALHATVMGTIPFVLALWLVHRTGATESVLATSAVVALSTFAVALPNSPGPVAKRIALGQIIIIYVAKFRRGDRMSHELVLGKDHACKYTETIAHMYKCVRTRANCGPRLTFAYSSGIPLMMCLAGRRCGISRQPPPLAPCYNITIFTVYTALC